MAEEKDGHYGKKELTALHDKNRVKSGKGKPKAGDVTDGGACLTGHDGDFIDFGSKSTCNYRFQAYVHSDSNATIKNKLHGYSTRRKAKIPTSFYMDNSSLPYPPRYCAEIAPPKPGDWDIGGPLRNIPRRTFESGRASIPVEQFKNFTRDTWPYWNNAHHIIPKGTLKARITQEGNLVSDLIQQCLLEAPYNINFTVNMVLLPQDREVAKILDVPRHLQQKLADGGVKKNTGNHPDYNNYCLKMRQGLNTIVRSYAKICQDALDKASRARKPEHKIPNAKLDKEKLHSLSRRLLVWLIGLPGGPSLDAGAKAAAKAAGMRP